jgi:hypothetical protein
MLFYQLPLLIASQQTKLAGSVRNPFAAFTRRLVLLGIALLLATLIPLLYVHQEQTIHFWDQAMYQDMASSKAAQLKAMWPLSFEGIKWQLIATYSSTGRDYSDYHTLLISPFLLVFGQSRLVYILALSWCYLLPFSLAIGLMATLLRSSNQQNLFWFATYLTLLTPSVWLPVLNGYPDIASAALLVLAFYFYFKDTGLQNKKYLFGMSACFALSILFRRHFAYDVLTFFVCASLHRVWLVVGQRHVSLQTMALRLLQQGLRICGIGVGMVVLLIVLGYPFVKKLTYTSYSHLYAAWEMDVVTNLIYYFSFYGWVLFAFVGIGIYYQLTKKTFINAKVAFWFICFFLTILSLLWVLKVKQLGFHYTLHFTPWLILLAVSIFWSFWHQASRPARMLLALTGTSYVLLNLWASLSAVSYISVAPYQFLEDTPSTNLAIVRRAGAASYPPPRREDLPELLRIITYLRSVALPGDPIYVAASSFTLNADLLLHVDRAVTHPADARHASSPEAGLNIFQWIPFADTKDAYPLDKIIQAEFIVVSNPIQYHLRPQVQQVIRVVNAAFTEQWAFSKDFQLLPVSFTFQNHVQAQIYQRIRPTSLPVALQTLQDMDAHMSHTPGGQLDWMGINAKEDYSVFRHLNGKHQLKCNLAKQRDFSFLYIHTPKKSMRLQGSLQVGENAQKIDPVEITLHGVDRSGVIVGSVRASIRAPGKLDLSFDSIPPQASYILLTIFSKATITNKQEEYWLTMDDLITENHSLTENALITENELMTDR